MTSRGNRRQAIFRDDEDRQFFLRLLATEVYRSRWACFAWCLMGNHFHLLLRNGESGLSRGMAFIKGTYTSWSNRKYEETGHVFEGRFHAARVENDDHFLASCRYIVLNPVTAGLVGHPRDWEWSSYRATAGEATIPRWMDVREVRRRLEVAPEREVQQYREFVEDDLGQAQGQALRA